GRGAAEPPAPGRRLAPGRGAGVALRARLSRAGRGARGVPGALRGCDRGVLRLPPLGQGARAARARGRALTPRGAAPSVLSARWLVARASSREPRRASAATTDEAYQTHAALRAAAAGAREERARPLQAPDRRSQ